MSKVHVSSFGISLDGFSAGADQSIENPLGVNGTEMMEWFFPTKTFIEQHGGDGGETGIDDDFAAKSMTGNGAWILGRNMFGPIRGPWPDDEWKGWWGDEPPYHVPTFVLTHHRREPIEMKGGTTFYFVTDGIQSALEQAKTAAGARDIRIGGGPATVRQYLNERLIDELHLAVRPILMGRGEKLFDGLDLRDLGYSVEGFVPGERAVHMLIRRQD
ncbi:MAG TPA: dihydrofolate reductase family protein [Pyrinomonadaceae bacterium]|nr:dihydrofolate reductase family protein [Pyrinomonadaceae bacterium]